MAGFCRVSWQSRTLELAADPSDIGVLAAMLQARHVRPALARKGELNVACTGLMVACFSFFFLGILPVDLIRESAVFSTIVLYTAATGLAYVSATVVTGLTAAAAACCDEEGNVTDESLRRGRALGGFRSRVSDAPRPLEPG